jgi:outer membrane protein OmpA-like peptidoglycan-associated protein
MKRLFLSIVASVFLSIFLFGQSKDSLELADDLINNQDFAQAIVFYKRFIQINPKNPDLYFKLGFCYLNTEGKRDSAIPCFKKALRLITTVKHRYRYQTNPQEIKFYLARAYRVNYEFDSAIVFLSQLRAEVRNRRFIRYIEDELNKAETGQELVQHPLDIKVVNLGEPVNSPYTEHTPVLTADESELFFTSRRKLWPDSKLMYDGEYDENIYVAHKDSTGRWAIVKPLWNIDTRAHEATISVSHDGTKLFIYKDDDNGSIYVSDYKNGQWTKPRKLGPNINTPYRETHCSMSVDGRTLFFTSDRPGGYGGLDIWVSHRQKDGTWGPAKNIGSVINTDKDEEAPFIFYDDRTLYFSSKGHNTMGGYDIFRSTLTDFGTWTVPENLGYPINSIEDDVFYFPTADNKRAYFASRRRKGYGRSDIYMMTIKQAARSPVSILIAKLVSCSGKIPPVDIMYTDVATGDYYVATPKNNKFLIVAHKGHLYKLQIESNGKIIYKANIFVPKNAPDYQVYKPIRVDSGKPCNKSFAWTEQESKNAGKLIVDKFGNIYDKYLEIQNILFPLNAVGHIPNNPTLNKLAKYLKENPGAVVQVIGYTDASGPALYNYKLGLKRAQAVRDYLIKHGARPNQVVAVSYGEENPIAINKNPDGTWNPQGQKYNRRVEFRILKQGKQTLLIKGMSVPKNLRNPHYKYNLKNPDVSKEVNY